MKKILTLLLLLISISGYSQYHNHSPFYGKQQYLGLNDIIEINTRGGRGYDLDIVREMDDEMWDAQEKLVTQWYNDHHDEIYTEFIRLVNESRNNLTVRKSHIFVFNPLDTQYVKNETQHVVLVKDKKDYKEKLLKLKETCTDIEINKGRGFFSGMKQKKGDVEYMVKYSQKVDVIKYDSLISLGCYHHNKFQINEYNHMIKDWETTSNYTSLVGHAEKPEYYFDHELVLPSFVDRMNYYTDSTSYPAAEIIYKGNLTFEWASGPRKIKEGIGASYGVLTEIKNNPSKEIAQQIFEGFKGSPKHWEIITSPNHYKKIGLDILIVKQSSLGFYCTVNFGY